MKSLSLGAMLLLLPGCDNSAQNRPAPPSPAQWQADAEVYNQEFSRQLEVSRAQEEKMTEQDRRYDALLDKWEEQARRFDTILDRWEKLLPPAQDDGAN